MPCSIRDMGNTPQIANETIERFFTAAFGPAPELYRYVSCCGWRHIAINYQRNNSLAEIFRSLSERNLKGR